MTREEVLLQTGRIIGLVSNLSFDDLKLAIEAPGLYPEYQQSIRLIIDFRLKLSKTGLHVFCSDDTGGNP